MFCLLQDKQIDTCIKTSKTIILYFSDHGFQFQPTKITVDFEQGLQGEINHTLADIEIVGCRIHVAQS